MDERELFLAADQALKSVIDKIKPEQWRLQLPAWFKVRPGQENLSLREIINYHAYDEAWVPETLAGRTIAEVGHKHDGDLLGQDPATAYARLMAATTTAVRALRDLNQPVHLTYGQYPAREYLWHISVFRGFRSYQIAKWIGADATMPPRLVLGLIAVVEPNLEQWRALGVFGTARPVPKGADAQTELLAKTGYLVS